MHMDLERVSQQDQSRIEDIGVELDPDLAPIPVAVANEVSGEAGERGVDEVSGEARERGVNEVSGEVRGADKDRDDIHDTEGGGGGRDDNAIDTTETYNPTFSDLDDGGNDFSFTERDHAIMNSQPTHYTYFNPSLLQKSWAGPSHWKLNHAAKSKKQERAHREHKKHITIEFSAEHVIKPSTSFPAVKRVSDLCMNETLFEAKGLHILPEDHHYSIEVTLISILDLVTSTSRLSIRHYSSPNCPFYHRTCCKYDSR